MSLCFCFTEMNSRYSKQCNGILVVNYLLTVSLCFTEMNSRYSKQCNGILVVNYLLTVSLCFTEMNSRYSKHCNGILVVNYLLTVSLCFTEITRFLLMVSWLLTIYERCRFVSPRWTRDILNTVMVSCF